MMTIEYMGGLVLIWITLILMASLFMWESFADFYIHSKDHRMFEILNPEEVPTAFDYSVDTRHGTGRYNPAF